MNELIDARRPVPLAAQDTPSAVSFNFDYISASPVIPGGIKSASAPEPERIFASFAEAFDYYGHRLLLLGVPGSGKTTTLLEAARDSAKARFNDAQKPLPLFARLDRYTNITEWEGESVIPDLVQRQLPGIRFAGEPLIYFWLIDK